MKVARVEPGRQPGLFRGNEKAFTLTEVVITLSVSLLISAGIVASQLYGMRMTQIAQAKVITRDKAGQILRLLSAEISSARSLKIGQGSFNSFTEAGVNVPQQGNAIQIQPTADSNAFIRYYWDDADKKLKRLTNDASSAGVVASAVSNSLVFTAEDYAGNILTNSQSRCVVGVRLDFFKLEDSNLSIGPGNYYSSYQLRTKIAPPAF